MAITISISMKRPSISAIVSVDAVAQGQTPLGFFYVPAGASRPQLLVGIPVRAREPGYLTKRVRLVSLKPPRHDEIIEFCASLEASVVPLHAARLGAEDFGPPAPLTGGGGSTLTTVRVYHG